MLGVLNMQVIILKHIVHNAYLFCLLMKDTICAQLLRKPFVKKINVYIFGFEFSIDKNVNALQIGLLNTFLSIYLTT